MKTQRQLNNKDLAYEIIANDWQKHLSIYDLARRIEVLVQDFLSDKLQDKECLDAGCGLGYFTNALQKYSVKKITAIDIAPSLIEKVKIICPNVEAIACDLLTIREETFLHQEFDVVISSEVIEHTPNPEIAVQQLCAVLKPGGYLALSCPNLYWKWLLKLALFLGLRKHYKGYENWLSPFQLKAYLRANNMEVIKAVGIHTVPWQFLPKFLLRKIDFLMQNINYYFSLNLAVLAKKLNK